MAWWLAERRAAEPVLPLRLFRNPVFRVALRQPRGGFALFGSISFLPLFLQVVHGVSPTLSGVYLLPMVGGLLITSITSGQLIARTGRYKIYPIIGTGVLVVALFLLSRLDENTPTALMGVYFFVLGFALGLILQVLVIAVQNAADYADLGAATSGVTFFRSIGGAFGVSVFGAIFSNQLARELAAALRGITLPPGFNAASSQANPALLKTLPAALRDAIGHAYRWPCIRSSCGRFPWPWWRSSCPGSCARFRCAPPAPSASAKDWGRPRRPAPRSTRWNARWYGSGRRISVGAGTSG